MNHPLTPLRLTPFRIGAALLSSAFLIISATADPTPPIISATDLAARLNGLQQDGNSFVRLRLEVKQPPGTTKLALQLQIKERRTKSSTDVLYQVLWPKERKGEAVLLRKVANQPAGGSLFVPPDTVHPLGSSQMKEGLFGSDVSYEDILENFYTWEQQALVGTDVLNRVRCQILESKSAKANHSSYASVRTWVDPRRLVPLRIEKYYVSGQLARRIDFSNLARDDNHRLIPANLTVQGQRPDSVTDLAGSRITHNVVYADRDFSPEALKELAAPPPPPK